MANDCIKYKEDSDHFTAIADGAAVTGKRYVYISGNRTSGPGLAATAEGSVYRCKQVGAGQAGTKAIGVASWDCPSGGMFTVIREGIVPVTAGAAITAGQEVEVDAQGRVIPLAAGVAVGRALSTQATVGADAEIMLYKS